MIPFRIIQGDCIEVMRQAKTHSVHAVVCDPPYGIEFMGETWDSPQRMVGMATGVSGGFVGVPAGVPRPEMAKTDPHLFQQWTEAWAREALRVLKPGGHLFAFGGTRLFHRLFAGIEDAGFEMRDFIAWIHGQGYPKAKQIAGHEGWKTAQLKPAIEPIVVARAPMMIAGKRPGTFKAATTTQNMDEHGVGGFHADACRVGDEIMVNPPGMAGWNNYRHGEGKYAVEESEPTINTGRFPANVMLDEAAADELGDGSKFFFISKASSAERIEGLDDKNPHPTVKPKELMRILARLSCPVGGQILDPFCGSGTTGVAALIEGFRFIGIEQDAAYVEIAQQRLEHTYNTLTEGIPA